MPYPEEGREAKDHLRPSALRKKKKNRSRKKGEHIKNFFHFQNCNISFYFSLCKQQSAVIVKAIPPPFPPFNLPNYSFAPFIPLFPQAFSSHPQVLHFLLLSDEGYTFGQSPAIVPHSSRPAVTPTLNGSRAGQRQGMQFHFECVCEWISL